jgi:Carboxypeptidase regulatory-like domain
MREQRMKPVFVCLLGVSMALALVACGGSNTTPTPAPTPTPTPTPAATVSAVVVSGPASATTTFQLSATAKMSDGTTQDVTGAARWESSDTTIATVTSAGTVFVMGSGAVSLKATFQNVTGSLQTVVNKPAPPRFILAGFVWEVDPNAHKIAGAKVTITSGPDTGVTVTSDVNGAYMFPSIAAGVVSLSATMDGYLPSSPEGVNVSANAVTDVFIAPIPPKDANGNTATARCSDRSWSWAQTRAEACTANGGIEYPVCPGVLCPANYTSNRRR